jgi:hypothetical protein
MLKRTFTSLNDELSISNVDTNQSIMLGNFSKTVEFIIFNLEDIN